MSQAKSDVVSEKLNSSLEWAFENRSKVFMVAGIVVAVLLVSSVFIIRAREMRDLNWTRLAQGQALSAQKDFDRATQIFSEVRDQNPGKTVGIYAAYYLAQTDLDAGKIDDAISNFSSVAQNSGRLPLKPLALSGLGFSQEEKKDYAAAAKTYQQFIDQFSEHFLAARVQLALGRSLLMAGDSEGAKKALGRLIDLYPTSPWAENARRLMDKTGGR